MTPELSIIVPVLNEAEALPALLAQLQRLVDAGNEVLLVDGGSSDGTDHLAAVAGFCVITSEAGRARQMNTGAALASGNVLLFLHADTQLPDQAAALVRQSLIDNNTGWGRFDVTITGEPAMLKVIAWFMNIRSRLSGIATGDQAIFVTRSIFYSVGGFPEQPLMEDIEFSKRLLKQFHPACIAQRATTSGRRWESYGVWKTIILMWRLRWLYWRGVNAKQLAKAYR